MNWGLMYDTEKEYRKERWTQREYAAALSMISETESRWHALRDEFEKRLSFLRSKDESTRFDHQDIAALEDDLKLCDSGYGSEDGATDPRIVALAGYPGLKQLRMLRERLTEELRVLREEKPMWPRFFTYTGPDGASRIEGKRLKQGDVVLLEEHQAEAFADRFKELTAEGTESEAPKEPSAESVVL